MYFDYKIGCLLHVVGDEKYRLEVGSVNTHVCCCFVFYVYIIIILFCLCCF